jgi:hypothetical protein
VKLIDVRDVRKSANGNTKPLSLHFNIRDPAQIQTPPDAAATMHCTPEIDPNTTNLPSRKTPNWPPVANHNCPSLSQTN